jgi:hypothetical protein
MLIARRWAAGMPATWPSDQQFCLVRNTTHQRLISPFFDISLQIASLTRFVCLADQAQRKYGG